jgi:hypothetical protein
MDRAALHSFLAQYRYGVVSSISSDETPQSALVGIAVTPSLEIIFDTLKTSRKYHNLTERSACSFVIGWSGEQTVQLEGTAFEPGLDQLDFYQRAYFQTWPDGVSRANWPGIAYFVVRPNWIRYTDYDKNPPLIHEVLLSQ